jgi:flagellar assembly factor FliW
MSVLVVVHPGGGDEAPTANLLAPVLVNRALETAAQVVLDEDWPVRASLVAPVA